MCIYYYYYYYIYYYYRVFDERISYTIVGDRRKTIVYQIFLL